MNQMSISRTLITWLRSSRLFSLRFGWDVYKTGTGVHGPPQWAGSVDHPNGPGFMDHPNGPGPWTTPMDRIHGPPYGPGQVHGPPLIFKSKSPLLRPQGCQKVPTAGDIAGYSEVFAGYELSRKSGKIKKNKEEEEKRWQVTIMINKETKTKEGKLSSHAVHPFVPTCCL